MYVTDNNGIHRVHLDGERVQIVRRKKLRRAAFSPDGLQIAYTDGKTLFWADEDGKNELSLAEKSPSFGALSQNDLRNLAYSPDGSKLAIAEQKRLILLNRNSMQATEIHKASDPIYWMSWLPGGNHLVFLAGLPTLRGVAAVGGVSEGHYKLFSISALGKDLVKIYATPFVDVRDASPSLSSDGRYVTFISARDNNVFVAATNGSGWIQLTYERQCSWPSWQPAARTN